ncbi:GGDEF domain-containing protein [Hoeflea sp. YIM 152468]|uniref:GGDEF domain-containing protein n=1 Tax=Hoeflea sp. YIM 152468 TaxID=3031759 RepID=UPI0023DCBEEF|nr:GGDEF domain-containing protein [Hoeflea sp. YIM 152468]MDF1607811.1 GGDEF domain-containing protein [Hoeflea sp. YIM 152468]
MVHTHNPEGIDPATTVTMIMREQGISSLPRNYELVYQFLNTSNAALIRDYSALGRRPTQSQLDDVGKKFLPHHHGARTVERARDRVSDEIRGMIHLFKQDQSMLERYSTLLGETSSQMSGARTPGPDALNGLARTLSSATGETQTKSQAFVDQMNAHAREMAALRAELEEYKRLASTDPVTRLSNRRAFDQRLAAIYADETSPGHHALLVTDIDHFKSFNDTYGHQVGDRVLSVAAAMMQNVLGADVFLARTGGEEFAIILDRTNLQAAADIAERIRLAIQSTPLKNQHDGVDCGGITMSFGLCMAIDTSSAEELYKKADMALYEAKKSGRNQLKIYTPTMKRVRAFFKR